MKSIQVKFEVGEQVWVVFQDYGFAKSCVRPVIIHKISIFTNDDNGELTITYRGSDNNVYDATQLHASEKEANIVMYDMIEQESRKLLKTALEQKRLLTNEDTSNGIN